MLQCSDPGMHCSTIWCVCILKVKQNKAPKENGRPSVIMNYDAKNPSDSYLQAHIKPQEK